MRALRTALLGLILVFLLLPFVPLAIWSAARNWSFPHILPQRWSGDAWAAVLADRSGVAEALATTLSVALAASLLALVIGVPAGRALGLHRFRGRGAVEAILFAPLIVPAIAVVMGLHTVMTALGLTNGLVGVVIVHLVPALPYVVFVSAAAFANLDTRFEEQARSLGASPAQVLRHVTLPAVLPGLVVAGLLAFLVSWSQYLPTLMVGGGRVITLPLLLFSFAGAGRHDLTGALALVYVLPAAIAMLFVARTVTGHLPGGGAVAR